VCDGVALLATRSCTVSMATLRAVPYSLGYGDVVQAIVAAINGQGTSAYSEVNTSGATMETAPVQMSAPTLDYSSSTLTSLTVNYVALSSDADTGGNTVDTYHLEFSSDSGVTWSTVQGNVGFEDLTLTGTESGSILGGSSYQF